MKLIFAIIFSFFFLPALSSEKRYCRTFKELRNTTDELTTAKAAEMAKDSVLCNPSNDFRNYACFARAEYDFTTSQMFMIAGCEDLSVLYIMHSPPTLKCRITTDQKDQTDQTRIYYSVFCSCNVSMCNDIFPFLEELKRIKDGMTSTTPTTKLPYNPYPDSTPAPFMCYTSENNDFKPRECPSQKCMFSSQKTDKGQVVTEYHCVEVFNNMKGCQIIDGKALHCYCLESLCNTKSWANPQINSFHSKRFTCIDYSDTKLETESKETKCNGPPQCTSYMHKTKKNEIQFEGGCVDGSRLESLYTDDCYFDKNYPDGPLFVCYCSESNCNNFDAFIEWAKEKKAYKWIEDAYKEVNSHRGYECFGFFLLLLFQLFVLY